MKTDIILFKEPPSFVGMTASLPAMFFATEKASERFFGFFTAHIRNRNTRRAYYKAACRFSDWCEGRGVMAITQSSPSLALSVIGIVEIGPRCLIRVNTSETWLYVGRSNTRCVCLLPTGLLGACPRITAAAQKLSVRVARICARQGR